MKGNHLPRLVAAWVLAAVVFSPIATAAQPRAILEAELERLRETLGIPSMSAAVAEGGTVVWVRHFGSNAQPGAVVRYPIASLTKPFTAALAMQLVEQGKLTLDDVGPLLSHTSLGGRFVYSSERFLALEPSIEQAAGTSFPSALGALTKALGMRNTTVSGTVTPGSGIESTVEDVLRLPLALERGEILERESISAMFRPPRSAGGRRLPYGLGWFVQQVGSDQVRWHHGQQADASALLVTVPRRRLSLVVLARGPRLTEPFMLHYGDVRWSPVAAAFLTQWAGVKIDSQEPRRLMTDALTALASGRQDEGARLATRASALAPALTNSPDHVLLAAFARSGDAGLRAMGLTIARRLLAVDPGDPRTLVDLAVLHIQAGKPGEAGPLLDTVLADGQATPELMRLARELRQELEQG